MDLRNGIFLVREHGIFEFRLASRLGLVWLELSVCNGM
jgi:hypothetical protein